MQCYHGYGEQTLFNLFAPSNRSSSIITNITSCYQRHEREKRRRYEQRVKEVERGTLVPVVFALRQQVVLVELPPLPSRLQWCPTLATSISGEPYSAVMGWIRRRFSLALLRAIPGWLACVMHGMSIAVFSPGGGWIMVHLLDSLSRKLAAIHLIQPQKPKPTCIYLHIQTSYNC